MAACQGAATELPVIRVTSWKPNDIARSLSDLATRTIAAECTVALTDSGGLGVLSVQAKRSNWLLVITQFKEASRRPTVANHGCARNIAQ